MTENAPANQTNKKLVKTQLLKFKKEKKSRQNAANTTEIQFQKVEGEYNRSLT